MRRRALLASLGALPAGCLGFSPGTDDGDRNPDGSGPPTPTPVGICDEPTATPTSDSSGGEASDGESSANGEFRLADLETSSSTVRPSKPYLLEPSAVYSADAVRREEERTGEEQVVRNVSEIEDEPVRDAVETAIVAGEWRADSLPDGLAETVAEVDFFTGLREGRTHTHVGLTLHRIRTDGPPGLAFDARVVDDVVAPGSPGAIDLELRNQLRTTQTIFSGTVPPFGMLFANAADDPERFLLWRDYVEEGCIEFTDDGYLQCDIGVNTDLRPCERLTRRYEVLPTGTDRRPEYTAPPGAGTYRIHDSVDYYEERGQPASTLSFEVAFTLEEVG
jgi:hypothetical protein